ncbi:unnamed protein product [Agarophyton chilense]
MPPFRSPWGMQRGNAATPTERTSLLQSTEQDGIKWLQTFRSSRPYMIPETTKLRLIALFSLVMVFCNKLLILVPPYAYKLAVDALANNLLGGPLIVPYGAIFLYIGSRVLADLIQAIQQYSFSIVASDSTKRFAIDLFSHLQNLSLAFHLQRKTGEVLRVMNRGTNSIETLFSTLLTTLLPVVFEVAVVSSIFLHLGTPMIALIILITVIAYFVYTIVVTKWRVHIRRDLIDIDNQLFQKAADTLLNYETVKMFGMEYEEATAYKDLAEEYREKRIFSRATLRVLNFGQSFIQRGGLMGCMFLAARAVAHGGLTPGDFVLINTYVSQIFQPLFFLGTSYRIISQAATDLEKSIDLMHQEVTVKDREDAIPLNMSEKDILAGQAGEVKFENVFFDYKGDERGTNGGLRNISFRVPPGKMVALVGSSGAGKSTIMRLLLRFYDVDSGKILIDGKDIRSFTQRSLRQNVGVVAQDTILFNKSLRYNISYGKQGASDAEVLEAAKSAALGPFIESLPLGLDTVVGERGVRLSGGERQRVGSARCVIKSPAVILLDEATSALDTFTERELQANLKEVCRNRTTIVVAHRLSTVMMADEIIVLGKDQSECRSDNSEDIGFDPDKGFETKKPISFGIIIERGSHKELLQRGGEYAKMWESQISLDKKNVEEMENN